MLFSKNYDESLLLVLKSDRKNRDGLIEFLKSIPQESYTKIQKDIKEMSDNHSLALDNIITDLIVSNNNETYTYNVFKDGIQIIKKGQKGEEQFEFTLCDFHFESIFHLFDDKWLGDVTQNKNETDYRIVKTPFGYFLTYYPVPRDPEEMASAKYIIYPILNRNIEIKDIDSLKKGKIKRLIKKINNK